ncbi:prepilin-type N-terminal cleavage/methylation domain-containing protein [Bradyrhizobium genosp. L]|uniref:prepilin-type N-terminal cleavage/methylation domain-containing protein n=1 Tax=Bradyrhizobium genosp. L TaxID=83637 RepID=UPI001FEE545A|nr:prepilin-type N-terminal cleavage/methylation domain-containing protein [Bradyrhizobium genosp. L]
MSLATSPTDRKDAGFTLLEVLVALALVAVSVIAIGSVMGVKTRGVRSLEQHVALMQATRTLMTVGIPPRDALQPGTSSGQADGYRWVIDVSPLGGGWTVSDANVPWTPELVRIRVKLPGGSLSDIRTVRLMPRPSE